MNIRNLRDVNNLDNRKEKKKKKKKRRTRISCLLMNFLVVLSLADVSLIRSDGDNRMFSLLTFSINLIRFLICKTRALEVSGASVHFVFFES